MFHFCFCCSVKESFNPANAHLFGNQTTEWIAFVRLEKLLEHCKQVQFVAPVHMFYAIYAAHYAQELGAAGFIYESGPTAQLEQFRNMVNVNIKKQTVEGVVLTMPSLVTKIVDAQQELFSEAEEWRIISFTADVNPFVEMVAPYGFYRMIWFGFSIYSFGLFLFAVKHTWIVYSFYHSRKQTNVQNRTLVLRMLIICPEVAVCLLRAAFALDPLGLFLIYEYRFSRILMNLFGTLSSFTNAVMSLYCLDVYRLFRAGNRVKKAESLASMFKYLYHFVVVWALIMVTSLSFDIFIL